MAITILIYIFFILLKIALAVTLLFMTLYITLLLWIKYKIEPNKGICNCKTKLHGKVALVTGGNAGIGLESARDLARRNATVIIACRDSERSKKAIADIINTTGNEKVEYRYLDLSKFSSVQKFADEFSKDYERLDILVNNAGCAGLKHRKTEDGLEIVMQINYFGPFLLTNLLLEKLIVSKPSRIVILTSYMHNLSKMTVEDLDGLNVDHYLMKYANSKLCNVLWTKALAKRLPEGVTVNSVHPGAVATDIFKRAPPFQRKLINIAQAFCFKTPEQGAQTTIHVCVADDLKNVSGEYFKDCKPFEYSHLAKNDEFIENVWEKSVEITKCRDTVQRLFEL